MDAHAVVMTPQKEGSTMGAEGAPIACALRVGRFPGRWRAATVRLQTSALAFALSSDATTTTSTTTIALAGATLRLNHAKLCATVVAAKDKKAKGASPLRVAFRLKEGAAFSAMAIALGERKEILRRWKDYFEIIGDKIGEGHTCRVYPCRCRFTRARYALKLSSKHGGQESLREMHNELRVLRYLGPHANVPELHDYFYDTSGGIALVLEELASDARSKLSAMVRESPSGMPEGQAREIFRSVIRTVAYLHGRGVCHRDLKIDNLMFARGDPIAIAAGKAGGREGVIGSGPPALKIIDYGFAKVNLNPQSWVASTPCGTMRYMAPELFTGRPYSQGVDLWALGCILHAMLFKGSLPFSKEQITNGDVDSPRMGTGERTISPAAEDLIRRLLSPASTRMGLEGVLMHAWFSQDAQQQQLSEEGAHNGDQAFGNNKSSMERPSPVSVLFDLYA